MLVAAGAALGKLWRTPAVLKSGETMKQESPLHSELAAGITNPNLIVAEIPGNVKLLENVFDGISSKLPRVKFGCSKTLLLLSEKNPELLSEKIDGIIRLIESENRILKWSAIAILGNLAPIDKQGRIKGQLRKLCSFLSGGELITANHAMMSLGKIARAFPDERKRITAELAGIEHKSFDTAECRNIAIGKAILAIEMFVDPAKPGKSVLDFARRQIGNRRRATANKAKAFIRKCSARSAENTD
jgi:hypothetical protein